MTRAHIKAAVERAVLVEAGHRCAIPTCRTTTTEIAHIVPEAETHDDSFENLIALCPTCHTRYDQKKEIDRKSIRIYKQNLAILNNRYSDYERRTFAVLAESGEELFMTGPDGDILLANAVKDGLFENNRAPLMAQRVEAEDGRSWSFPMSHIFEVTDEGKEFLKRYERGEDIA